MRIGDRRVGVQADTQHALGRIRGEDWLCGESKRNRKG
jgi:hypothetical protein